MSYLENVNNPDDLKKLDTDSLEVLASEIRQFLINSISKTGGHLASNLGVVELTIALHYVYNTPEDKIVFDVGHQAYVHKMLTGRKDEFHTLRQLDGLSGFPSTLESVHDSFDTGHSTTSLSVATGFMVARELKGMDNNVIAVIGDGSITGGQAFEAMNDIGRQRKQVVVILNDNEMSISENVGAVSKMLSNIRMSKQYTSLKKGVYNKLDDENKAKEVVRNMLKNTKDTIKNIVVRGQVFEKLGFTYIGPIDGNDISELINTLNLIKNIETPVLLHIHTKKGIGYLPAEKNPSKFHGIAPFDVKTGATLKVSKGDTFSDVVSETLLYHANLNEKLLFVSAAMITGTGLSKVNEKYPKRTFDVGICEQHAVTFCAGLAKEGFIPMFCVYSTFLQRAYDQILHDVCIQNLHVIFMIDRAGIVGEDGKTHQGVFDISYLSHIPNMTILAPKSGNELKQMIDFAISHNGPIAIRYPRGKANEYDYKDEEVVLSKSQTICEGDDVLIVSVGNMFSIAKDVVFMLENENISTTFINARFIKPIDEAIGTNCKKYKKIVTIEDNVLKGGFSESLLPILYKNGFSGEYINFGYEDDFIPHGNVNLLYEKYGLTKDNIYSKIIK